MREKKKNGYVKGKTLSTRQKKCESNRKEERKHKKRKEKTPFPYTTQG
jgi:hypothetical protein